MQANRQRGRRGRMRRLILGLIAALSIAGCTQTARLGPSPVAVPEGAVFDEVKSPADAARMFVQVTGDIEPLLEAICERAYAYRNCDFWIVVDDTPDIGSNAYQTLDRSGRPIVAFTLPILSEMKNRDEFAFVLAHEASHHILGHIQATQQNAVIGAEVLGAIAAQMGDSDAQIAEARKIGADIAARSYSKQFELEADAMAARILKVAGYDALRGAAFFNRIPDPGDEFLGSHPSTAERLANVRQALQD